MSLETRLPTEKLRFLRAKCREGEFFLYARARQTAGKMEEEAACFGEKRQSPQKKHAGNSIKIQEGYSILAEKLL